jgi:hypothetical protein
MYNKIRDFYRFYDTTFQQGGYSKIHLDKYIEIGEEIIEFEKIELERLKNDLSEVKTELISLYIRKFRLEESVSFALSQKAQKLSIHEELIQEAQKKKENYTSLYIDKMNQIDALHNILNELFGTKKYIFILPTDVVKNDTPISLPTKDRPFEDVYFMINRDTGHIKIGYSRDPQTRLSSLKSELSTKNIDILATIPCGFQAKKIERLFHILLNKYQVTGEWFDIPEKIVPFLSSGNNLPFDFAESVWRVRFEKEGAKKLEKLAKLGVANATS